MRWFRRKAAPEPKIHRGRIWRDGEMWRWSCNDCDYGAGTSADGSTVGFPWLVDSAASHADPSHWSRR